MSESFQINLAACAIAELMLPPKPRSGKCRVQRIRMKVVSDLLLVDNPHINQLERLRECHELLWLAETVDSG